MASRYRCAVRRWQPPETPSREPVIDPVDPRIALLLLPLGLFAWGCVPALAGIAVQAADRGVPFRLGRETLAVVAREGAVRTLVRVMLPFGRDTDPKASEVTDPVRDAVPVLLVPSPPANRAALTFMVSFLRHRGLPWVHSVNTGRGTTLDAMATDLAMHVLLLKNAAGVERVDVVAHGTSGLAVAWWVRHMDGAQHIRRIVTLGTPWAGTRMAVFMRGSVAPTLMPDAAILDDLAPCPVPTIAIGSPSDPFVVPSSSAHPEGAVPVVLEGAGHTDLLMSARAFRAVFTALTEPMTESMPDPCSDTVPVGAV